MNSAIKVSAPGSMMITGEHAVVYGHPAIVCAIEQRVVVKAEQLEARMIEIHSDIAEPFSVSLDSIEVGGPLKFVLAIASRFSERLDHGVKLTIDSQIDPTMGFGSSAAVTAAVLAAIDYLACKGAPKSIADLHLTGLAVIRELQGRGSGADLAASLHGGMLAYQLPASTSEGNSAYPTMQALPILPTPSLKYSGFKTPTAEVLALVAAAHEKNKPFYDNLYIEMGRSAAAAISAAEASNWQLFAQQLQAYQQFMQSLGVSNEVLENIISTALSESNPLAVKISGSGLGDCVLAIGPTPKGFTPITIASHGVIYHD